ncbi:hypothetical protein E2562_037208 [Oryza meyeriana var. granulata]|uniref:Terpene synthase metal-binding domain-containing protein n=1 Tax=Oryza meyeriana var. granulata TaxID=110450 RepID=A0A6G1CBD3_9ORYZ|nr:hypothetical protein E2562_037208 [Oryza meyeriana var. granulata]
MYLEQYGGSSDVWLTKVLFRMRLFYNDLYLKVAQADFRNFQRICRLEWTTLERWHSENNFQTHGVTQKNALRAYFLAAANIFEPDRAEERLVWARTAMLAQAFSWPLQRNDYIDIMREDLH